MTFPSPERYEPSVVVLGGTGFIGRVLLENWPTARRPRYLVHRSLPEWVSASGMTVQRVDLDDSVDLRAALAGADTLINLLRPDGQGWYPELLQRLGPIAREAGLRHCIHASSIDVYTGSKADLIDEETAVEPTSRYETEHCEAERIVAAAFPHSTILRIGAVFGPGGRNVVSFASEMAKASFLKLALRRSLYGQRRMYLVSANLVAAALSHFALCRPIIGQMIVLLTQDDDPNNNFAFVQDSLAESFGRYSLQRVPALPSLALSLALRFRQLPPYIVGRRFSVEKAQHVGLKTEGFSEALRAYTRSLATDLQMPS